MCSGCWETAPTHFFPTSASVYFGNQKSRDEARIHQCTSGLGCRQGPRRKAGEARATASQALPNRYRASTLPVLSQPLDHGRPVLLCCIADYGVQATGPCPSQQPSDIHPRCLGQTKQPPALQFYLGRYLTETQSCRAGANDASPITLSVCPVQKVQKHTLRAAAPRLPRSSV